jgi:hypothetical protein
MMGDSTYRNPAIGKANAFRRVSEWFPDKKILYVAQCRFNQWMSSSIGGHVSVFLPRWMGGYGFPWLKSHAELAKLMMEHLHPGIFKIHEFKTRTDEDYPTVVDFLVRRMATGNTVRGLLDPMPYVISAQYANLTIHNWMDKIKSFGDLADELQNTKSYSIRSKDVISYARRSGLMSYHDIVDQLDRLTAIRITMLVAHGSIEIEDVLPSRREKLPNPNEVVENFFSNEIGYFHMASFDRSSLTPTLESIHKFREWVESGMRDCPVNTKQMFLPQAALIDSLAGMNIPLPYRPGNPVKGSIEDPDVALITGYIAKMVSLRRTKRI